MEGEGSMGEWKPYFHWGLDGHYFFFAALPVSTVLQFIISAIFLTFMCWAERWLTFYMDTVTYRPYRPGERWRSLITRTSTYGVVTTLRLCYMIIVMTLNVGLFAVVVTGLTTGQFLVEYVKSLRYSSGAFGETNLAGARGSPVPIASESAADLSSSKLATYRDDIELQGSRSNFVISENDGENVDDDLRG